MNHRSSRFTAALGAATSLLCAGSLSAQLTETLPLGGQRARALTSSTLPETRAEIQLPELGLVVYDVRRQLDDGTVERFGLDAAGAPVDVDALRREDHALGHARRGKLAPHLLELVENTAPAEQVEVAFWLAEPGGDFDARRELQDGLVGFEGSQVAEAIHVLRPAVQAQAAAHFAPSVQAFAELVEAAGGDVLVAGRGWPLVIANVPAGAVRALAADAAVDEAYWSRPEFSEEGEWAQGTLRSRMIHAAGTQADGSVRVMVNDTAQVYGNNLFLPPIINLNTDGSASHATGVAGNIANSHLDHYAASYKIPELYSAGGSGDVTAPINWDLGLQAGIDFGNCSWWNGSKGSIVFLDRFFDYTIRTYSVMMFKSTGNQGSSSTPYTTTPGNGYNMTNTGNYNDANNFEWADDFMTASSSYWDPIEGHEKPEIASPGDCVATTTTSPLGITSCFGGTSSASPLTCGVATLVASGDNTLLGQMTTVKAMLMASAWHNVEGEALLSEKDGAGGVHAWAAHNLVDEGQWWYDDVVDADFVGGVLDVTMPLLAGDETRVCALWFSSANSAYTTDVLEMDVDLAVLDPSGTVVATSASALNPFELTSFVPVVSGDYTVRLSKQRFDGQSEPLTVAWSTRSDASSGHVRPLGDGQLHIGATNTMRVGDKYLGAGKQYLLWAALQGPQGWPVTPTEMLPSGFDPLSNATLTLPGWQGTLGAGGQAGANLPLPQDAQLTGIELHFGLVILDPQDPDGVASMNTPQSYTIQP